MRFGECSGRLFSAGDGQQRCRVKCILPAVLALLFCTGTLSAQQYDPVFEHLTTRHGLSGARIQAVVQDRQGFIWVGTESGVARFDGYNFVPYSLDTPGAYRISNLYADRSGTVWVGMWDGLYYVDATSEKIVRHPYLIPEFKNIGVNSLFEDREGLLWIATTSGLARLTADRRRIRWYHSEPANPRSLSSDNVIVTAQDRDGTIWVGTREGLNRLHPKSGVVQRYLHNPVDATSLSNNSVVTLLVDRQGVVWVGTEIGLNRFDPRTGRFVRYLHDPKNPRSLYDSSIKSMYQDKRGTLWVGTFGGARGGVLHLFNPVNGTFRSFKHDPYNPGSLRRNYQIATIMEDRSGVLWIGTGGGYISKLNGASRQFVHYRLAPGQLGSIGHSYVFNVLEDSRSAVWTGTDNGLDRLDRKTGGITHFDHSGGSGGLSSPGVRSIIEDHAGRVWVGTEGGLDRYLPASNSFVHFRPDGKPFWVSRLLEDRYQKIWVGTNRGLKLFDPASETFLPLKPAITSEGMYVTSLQIDRSGMMWVGTRAGLRRFQTVRQRAFDLPPAISRLGSAEVRALLVDSKGRVWVGAVGDGLWMYDPVADTARSFYEKDGMADNTAVDLVEDKRGRIWVRTVSGISRLDPTTGRFFNIAEERVLGANLNEWGSLARNRQGEFIYAGDDGLVFFYPERIFENPSAPQVVLTRLSIFGQPVYPGKNSVLEKDLARTEQVRLAYHQNDVSFDFVGLHFARPELNTYSYILEPYDRTWRPAGTQRRATYTNLSPGTYTFRVKAANADGVWSKEGVSIKVIIVPPFWLRGWFIFLCLIAAAFAVRFGFRARVRHLHAQARELAHHVEIRTHELVLEKQKTEEQALRLQEMDEIKSRLFANISHEFRTPLTLIVGPLEEMIAGRYGTMEPQVASFHRTMLDNARRLLRIVGELLDLSKIESGKMNLDRQPGNLVVLIERTVSAFLSMSDLKGIQLRFRSEEKELHCLYDSDKLEKVFSNLLSNAMKFTPEGGKVWVTLAVVDGTEIEVVVKDTGSGIPKESLGLIFERFQQVDNSSTRTHPGTGIGLSLVKDFVEMHEGTVSVESEPGFGVAFRVRLPLLPAQAADEEKAPEGRVHMKNLPLPHHSSGDGSAVKAETVVAVVGPNGIDAEAPLTVLVVEDHAEVRTFLKGLLGKNYRVLEADDGESGWECFRKEKPDLVLCDVMLPRLDGFGLCDRIKKDKDLSLTPVIILTARSNDEDRIQGLRYGADDYMSKPFNPVELETRIENLIRARDASRSRYSREIVVQPNGAVVGFGDEGFLSAVLDTINARLSDSTFNVESLAEEVKLSRRQFHRKVHALLGESPTELIRRMRLERARQLLSSGGTVSEVAYQVGYSSPSNFARAFRDLYGCSPSAFVEKK